MLCTTSPPFLGFSLSGSRVEKTLFLDEQSPHIRADPWSRSRVLIGAGFGTTLRRANSGAVGFHSLRA